MRIFKRAVSLIVAAAFLACVLTGCGGSAERDIERLTQRFCDAYNEVDVEGMLDCLEPSMANTVESMIELSWGLMTSLLDIDLDITPSMMYDLAAVCFDVLPDSYGYANAMPVLEIDLEDIQVDESEEYAVAQATITVTVSGQSESYSGPLYYRVADGDWCISNENFKM